MKTALEMLDRMEALVRKIATAYVSDDTHSSLLCEAVLEADAIVAELPKPRDPKLLRAARIIQDWRAGHAGEDDAYDTATLVAKALA